MKLKKEAFLAAAMALSVTACGSEAPEEEDTTGDEQVYEAPPPPPAPEPEPEPEPYEPEPAPEPAPYAPTDE